ncbi:hypothetical protein V6L77_07310 [Pannonibacter sp. Pt2-lr]
MISASLFEMWAGVRQVAALVWPAAGFDRRSSRAATALPAKSGTGA